MGAPWDGLLWCGNTLGPSTIGGTQGAFTPTRKGDSRRSTRGKISSPRWVNAPWGPGVFSFNGATFPRAGTLARVGDTWGSLGEVEKFPPFPRGTSGVRALGSPLFGRCSSLLGGVLDKHPTAGYDQSVPLVRLGAVLFTTR